MEYSNIYDKSQNEVIDSNQDTHYREKSAFVRPAGSSKQHMLLEDSTEYKDFSLKVADEKSNSELVKFDEESSQK